MEAEMRTHHPTRRYLYPRQRQVEVIGALYAGSLGVYIGVMVQVWGVFPLYWMGADQLTLAHTLVTASAIWAFGIYINGAWWFSPFLRLIGLLIHFMIALWAVKMGAGSSASFTYSWVAVGIAIGIRNAGRDSVSSWRARWTKLNL